MNTFAIILNLYLIFILTRSLWVICIGFLYKSPTYKSSSILNNSLKVSVLIPAWNEEVGIAKTIKSVLANNYENIEVLVINDGSTDNTARIVRPLVKKYPDKLIFINNRKNRGKWYALNCGLKRSTGDIIINIDADSYVMKETIGKIVLALNNQSYDAATGEILVGNLKNSIGIIQYLEYNLAMHFKKTQSYFNSIIILPGALCAIKRYVFDKIGGYEDYSRTEDLDLSLKLRLNNYNVIHVNEAKCITEGASDLKSLINQRTRWKHGGLLCFYKYKNILFNDQIKSKYLSHIEYPLVFLGIIENLIFPFLWIFIIYSTIISSNFSITIIFYLYLPFVLILFLEKKIIKHPKLIPYILLSPILFNIISIVEHIALINSIKKILFRQKVIWTSWKRLGA